MKIDIPTVSVVIAMYNEEKFIERCLQSIIDQDYPSDKFNIVIIDGGSTDRSKEIVCEMMNKFDNLVLLDNPQRKIAIAFNIGIYHSSNDIIALMSAHAIAQNNYISLCVKHLKETGAANVGGIMDTQGSGLWGECIATGTSSPFGIGNSKHRYSDQSGYDDAGWPGAFWRMTLLEMNGFDESLGLNEDDDLNYRLVKAGYKIFHTPEIKTVYFSRSSLLRLWKQYFKYGFWKIPVIRKYGSFTSFRHFVPSLFVIVTVCLILNAIYSQNYLYISLILGIYFSIAIFNSIFIAWRESKFRFLLLPLIYFILHFSYGIGFIAGLSNLFRGEK